MAAALLILLDKVISLCLGITDNLCLQLPLSYDKGSLRTYKSLISRLFQTKGQLITHMSLSKRPTLKELQEQVAQIRAHHHDRLAQMQAQIDDLKVPWSQLSPAQQKDQHVNALIDVSFVGYARDQPVDGTIDVPSRGHFSTVLYGRAQRLKLKAGEMMNKPEYSQIQQYLATLNSMTTIHSKDFESDRLAAQNFGMAFKEIDQLCPASLNELLEQFRHY